jgi:hypothetical protein
VGTVGLARTLASAASAHNQNISTSSKDTRNITELHSRSFREGKAANKSKKPQNGLPLIYFLQIPKKKFFKTLNISVKIRLKKSQGSLFFESCSFH